MNSWVKLDGPSLTIRYGTLPPIQIIFDGSPTPKVIEGEKELQLKEVTRRGTLEKWDFEGGLVVYADGRWIRADWE